MTGRRILVTGTDGLLAPYLLDAATPYGDVVTSSREAGNIPCDLADPHAVCRMLGEVRPDWLVHAAAMTDVDRCEAEPACADRANRGTVANLVTTLGTDTRFVLLSTDQVYPDTEGPHGEADVGPVNVYGRTKLAGEREALRHPNSLVLRTNLFGPSRTPGRQSLDDFVVENLRKRCPITLFTDVLFSPLHMMTLARTLFEALARGMRGVYNLGSRQGMSKAEFALAVAAHLGLDTGCASLGLSAQITGRVARASDLRMNVNRIEKALGYRLPTLLHEIQRL